MLHRGGCVQDGGAQIGHDVLDGLGGVGHHIEDVLNVLAGQLVQPQPDGFGGLRLLADVLGLPRTAVHTLAGIGVSLGLSMNFEAVTARYVDVRLERKKEVLDAYHGAVKQADPAKAKEAEPKKAKSAAKKKSSEIEL